MPIYNRTLHAQPGPHDHRVANTQRDTATALGRQLVNKVPEVTAFFWIIKFLATTVGETAADLLNTGLGWGRGGTSAAAAVVLAVVLVLQFRARRYVPAIYWLAVLFTFALGTAAGDLVAEGLDLGYWKSALGFAALIALTAGARYLLKLNVIVAFWIAYILTHPLGASLGDYLAQAHDDGGLGLGTVSTSALFLGTILGVVSYLTVTSRDARTLPESA